MFRLLKEPHPVEPSIQKRLYTCIVFGVFVFLFLFVFRPFGLNELPTGILPIALGYGFTCFVVMVVLNIAIPRLTPHFFNEENWTLGKELFWISVNIFCIGIANAVYTSFALGWHLSIQQIAVFEGFTLAIGCIPTSVMVWMKHNQLRIKYQEQAQELNNELHTENHAETTGLVTLTSENRNEDIALSVNNLIVIRSAENYVEVIYMVDAATKKQLLRNTLKNISQQLEAYPSLLRCHKSYLVNLDKVIKISGNAQGYKLHLESIDEPVPVSRNLNEEIIKRLKN